MLRPQEVAQGDVFEDVRFLVPLPEGMYEDSGNVIVISHGCDCEKSLLRDRDRPVLISPLMPLDDLPGGQPGDARAGRMARYWPLGGPDPRSAEFGVDLLLIQPILVDDLLLGTRRRSIDDNGQILLGARVAKVITYREFKLPETTCDSTP